MSETSEVATPEDFKVIAPAHVDRTRYITALMGRRDNLDTQVLWDHRWVSLPITDDAMALFPFLKLSLSATSLQPPAEFFIRMGAKREMVGGVLLATAPLSARRGYKAMHFGCRPASARRARPPSNARQSLGFEPKLSNVRHRRSSGFNLANEANRREPEQSRIQANKFSPAQMLLVGPNSGSNWG
jgi:hypothetical protein